MPEWHKERHINKMSGIFDIFKQISQEKEQTQVSPITHIVAGLGNPEKQYLRTRHNAGFMFIDYISQKYNFSVDRLKFHALTGETVIGGKRVLVMKPQTYMNKSGEAVRDAAQFYKIPAENIIIVFDDIYLDAGRLRVRRKGSDGGHNGIKDIIYQLQSDNFPRIKLGVGKKPTPEYDLISWVLGEIPESERKSFFEAISNGSQALELMLEGKTDEAMCRYN